MKKIYLFVVVFFTSIYLWAQPVNDNLCNATMLNIGEDCSTTFPYSNEGATAEIGEPIGDCYGDSSAEQSVWFTFVPSLSAISITTDFWGSGLQNSQLAVYELTGGDCTNLSNLVQIACNEDRLPKPEYTNFNAGLPSILVNAGATYYIQVDGFNGDYAYNEGSFCILVNEVNPPSNDTCDNAIQYGGFGPASCLPASFLPALAGNLTTVGATASDNFDFFSCDDTGVNATVFYAFPFGQDSTAEVEFQLLAGENINVAVLESGCDSSLKVVGDNCFTGLNYKRDDIISSINTALFSGLEAGKTYHLAIWTNEGEAGDFDFCMIKRPQGYYECGDGVCYGLAENNTNCPVDCPCDNRVDIRLYSLTSGSISNIPTGVCAEIINGKTDPNNPGLYVPFLINNPDFNLTGTFVTSAGELYTNFSSPDFFRAFDPLVPLPNNEANAFINYIFFTEAEIEAEETVSLGFISDDGTCDTSIEVPLVIFTILPTVDANECGNCNLVATPDYSTLQCPDFNLEIDVEGAVGNTWISQNNTTIFDAGDIPLPYLGRYPNKNSSIRIYDSGQPNCAVQIDLRLGDYFCNENNMVETVCRLKPPEILCR